MTVDEPYLSGDDWELLTMRLFHGAPLSEAAKAFGTTEAAIRQREARLLLDMPQPLFDRITALLHERRPEFRWHASVLRLRQRQRASAAAE